MPERDLFTGLTASQEATRTEHQQEDYFFTAWRAEHWTLLLVLLVMPLLIWAGDAWYQCWQQRRSSSWRG